MQKVSIKNGHKLRIFHSGHRHCVDNLQTHRYCLETRHALYHRLDILIAR